MRNGMSRVQRRFLIIACMVLFGLGIAGISPLRAQNSIDVKVERWLQVKALSGDVQFLMGSSQNAAQVGDRLANPGDGVRTGNDSSCTLEVDENVGTITLNENTELVIRQLDYAPDDGRITKLTVMQGNVILNLRRFTNRGSELEIETPSAVSGVRGTEFGIIVHPEDQRTAVAAETGEVFATAEGSTVDVPGGFQTLVRLGEEPLEPMPIPERPELDFVVKQEIRNNLRFLVLIGRINPINQVYVADELQTTTEAGDFRYESLAYHGTRVQVRVVTPLGDAETYDISLL